MQEFLKVLVQTFKARMVSLFSFQGPSIEEQPYENPGYEAFQNCLDASTLTIQVSFFSQNRKSLNGLLRLSIHFPHLNNLCTVVNTRRMNGSPIPVTTPVN